MNRRSHVLCFAVLALFAWQASTFAEPVGAKNPAAEAANAEFEKLQAAWIALEKQVRDKTRTHKAESDKLLGELFDTGLKVYQVDSVNYPTVNSTLLAIPNYFVLGDAKGDGGDQFEKALPQIKSLVAAGAADSFPQLWLLGGASAFCTNDFPQAREYFQQAETAGLLGDSPPDPQLGRLWQLAKGFAQSLAEASRNWGQEQTIRAAEKTADDLPRVKLTTTGGEIVIELFENEAPQAVANFISLVKKGFYSGVPFHRVLPGFMAQGGDPTGTGSGGPGYSIRCECHGQNYRHHFRGSLSMAHAGRDTGGSQFFLTFVPTSFLDGRHTVFGRVIEGMDIAAGIQRRDPDAPGKTPPDEILRAAVLRDRGHEYKFEKLPER